MEDCYNRVELCGEVLTLPEPSHTNHGETFYRFMLAVPRLSGQSDELPVLVRQSLLPEEMREGDTVSVTGQLRSFNNRSGQGRRLILSVFARNLALTPGASPVNRICLYGAVCKPPVLRSTPLGREICDILLAVNRQYGKSDYIPCITWGRNAKFTSTLEVGTNIKIWGRIQSREYKKKIGEDEYEDKVAYEVSVSKLEVVK